MTGRPLISPDHADPSAGDRGAGMQLGERPRGPVPEGACTRCYPRAQRAPARPLREELREQLRERERRLRTRALIILGADF